MPIEFEGMNHLCRHCPGHRARNGTSRMGLVRPRKCSRPTALVKVCGCRPHDGGAAHTGAGVRKPPMEETAGSLVRWRVRRGEDLSAVSASTTFAIWHELCEWVKTPFAAPVISVS